MTDHPFNNDASMAEKRRVLRDASSFQQHAVASTQEMGGRFAAQRPNVIGAGAVYPAASPHQGADSAPEPVLGFDVNAIVPVGEIFEIEASIRGERDAGSPVHRRDDEGDDRGERDATRGAAVGSGDAGSFVGVAGKR
jgi:hypothetical protein